MATYMKNVATVLSRLSSPVLFQTRHCQLRPPWPAVRTLPGLPPFAPPSHSYCKAALRQEEYASQLVEALSRYKERPWDYLDSEGYVERYGSDPVWKDYRRNHKGGIPPQKTRKTCIRGDKICGNPCPICRDPNIIIHHQNVRLLQQFISPHSGTVYDQTRTGVCMKQQKHLNEAINTARDHGLLPVQIPFVDFAGEDYSNSHDAVGLTPPPPSMTSGDDWYRWYGELTPNEKEVAKVRKTYKDYLKS